MFAQVILPLPLHNTYTYNVPDQWQSLIKPGQRVVVQFGSRKMYAALVYSLSEESPDDIDTKEILEVLDEDPVVPVLYLEFWKWIAAYYCCALGDVFKAALPPGLKLESKSAISLDPLSVDNELTPSESDIVRQIEDNVSTLEGLQKKLGSNFSFSALKALLSRNIIRVEEQISKRYKPKLEPIVRLHPRISSEEMLHQVVDSLERAKKQQALLLKFVQETETFSSNQRNYIFKKQLLSGKGFTASILKELVDKEILVLSQREVSRIIDHQEKQADLNLLNSCQQKALSEINDGFAENQVVLIHGITASGKTEIYIHLIDEAIRAGRQALYLLPEIALTTQIIERLKNVFGAKVGIYHSRLTDHERVEIYNKVLQFKTNPQEGYQVILGARSAVFMPFSRLGLIVVDEEHENSFKQFDPAPRYHARDMAVVLGKLFQANVLLGSATPSYESYLNALSGKYRMVKLDKRHSELEHPEIIVADIKKAYKRKQMRSVLTPELYTLMDEALKIRSRSCSSRTAGVTRHSYSVFHVVLCQGAGIVTLALPIINSGDG